MNCEISLAAFIIAKGVCACQGKVCFSHPAGDGRGRGARDLAEQAVKGGIIAESACLAYVCGALARKQQRLCIQDLFGVDVGFHSDDHSWAVICIAGRPEYVKFLPLKHKDTMEIVRFLKQFQYSNKVIDSPFGFKEMVENYILKGET